MDDFTLNAKYPSVEIFFGLALIIFVFAVMAVLISPVILYHFVKDIMILLMGGLKGFWQRITNSIY